MPRKQKRRKLLPELERKNLVDNAIRQIWDDEDSESRKALPYLHQERGLSHDQIRRFEVGYVPRFIKAPNGEDSHEFAGRIIFPIKNQYGDLVAISSRDTNPNSEMKFFHESFNKSHYLYGLDLAKERIMETGRCIVVEGELDTISMHQFGFKSTVGALGSAFQLHHISLLLRYCNEVFLLFDSDNSGLHNVKRCLDIYEERVLNMYGVKVHAAMLPFPSEVGQPDMKKIDPDWYLRNYGQKGLMSLLTKARETSHAEIIKLVKINS